MGTLRDTARRFTADQRLVRLALLAVLVRVVVVVLTTGSNDLFLWGQIAEKIRAGGLMDTYATFPTMNHPPLPALYMSAALAVTETVGVPFSWMVKIPALVGELAIGGMIWHVLSGRTSPEVARRTTVVYLFNPLTILLAAFHGNTDMVYAAFVFAATIALTHRRPVAAGVLFGAALNVKLLPVALAAGFLAVLWRRETFWKFAAGTAAALVPVWAVIVAAPTVVPARVLLYQTGTLEPWGLVGAELAVRDVSRYHAQGRFVLAAALVTVAVVAYRRRLDPYQSVGLAAVTFLVFAPAFGVQYLAVAVPFVFVTAPKVGVAYLMAGGLFLTVAYGAAATWVLPVRAVFTGPLPPAAAGVGAVVWAVCVWALVALLRPSSSGDGDGVLVGDVGLDRVPV